MDWKPVKSQEHINDLTSSANKLTLLFTFIKYIGEIDFSSCKNISQISRYLDSPKKIHDKQFGIIYGEEQIPI